MLSIGVFTEGKKSGPVNNFERGVDVAIAN